MKWKKSDKLPFLHVLIRKKGDGMLGYQVHRKKTHTDRYVHADSHHNPPQKLGIIHTLAIRASRISDHENLNEELQHLKFVFKANGYKEG